MIHRSLQIITRSVQVVISASVKINLISDTVIMSDNKLSVTPPGSFH